MSRREIAAALTIIAALAFIISFSSSSTAMRWRLEWKALNWNPGEVDQPRPDESLLSPSMEIAGQWSARLGRSLTISRRKPDGWTVVFSKSSCTCNCELERVGEFENGVLSLNRPLAESELVVYDKYYAVRIEDTDYLLPGDRVESVQKALAAADKATTVSDSLCGYVYERRRLASSE